jgi:hypothetical protein
MAHKNWLGVAVWCVLLASCGRGAPTETGAAIEKPVAAAEPLPALDTQSPDAVVRSYWALQDWAAKNSTKELRLDVGPTLQKFLDTRIELSGGDFRAATEKEAKGTRNPFPTDSSDIPRVVQRDILEVKNESQTRAIVLTKIRNVTPIPSNYKLEEFWQKKRDYGEDVRYVVEKINGKWCLTQAWYRDDSLVTDWTKAWDNKPPATGPSPFNFYFVEH